MNHRIINADVLDGLAQLEEESVHCCVTSPPYWGLRNYSAEGQLGLEPTPEAYIEKMVAVFREVRRVLRDDGTLWLNMGDSYASGEIGRHDRSDGTDCEFSKGRQSQGKRQQAKLSTNLKPKDLCGMPWRLALALQADGWYLRSDIIWSKPNPMPESCTDRPTKAHEYVFLLTKAARYFYDAEAIKSPVVYPNDKRRPLGSDGAWALDGRARGDNGGGKPYDGAPTRSNARTVWHIPTQSFPEAHFATFPLELPTRCIKAGTSEPGCDCVDYMRTDDGEMKIQPSPEPATVLDPFSGAATTGVAATQLGRSYIGIELNPEYAEMGRQRIEKALRPATHRTDEVVDSPLFAK